MEYDGMEEDWGVYSTQSSGQYSLKIIFYLHLPFPSYEIFRPAAAAHLAAARRAGLGPDRHAHLQLRAALHLLLLPPPRRHAAHRTGCFISLASP